MSISATLPPYAHVSHIQEAFSEAYVRAVCANAGCSIQNVQIDNDKIDMLINSRVQGAIFTKPLISLQLKCQRSGLAMVDPIPYALSVETYDNLRDPKVMNPRILVVVLVPDNPIDWIAQNETQLEIKHCGYWVSLKNHLPAAGLTSKTVHLPRANIFSPDALRTMMQRAADGLDLV